MTPYYCRRSPGGFFYRLVEESRWERGRGRQITINTGNPSLLIKLFYLPGKRGEVKQVERELYTALTLSQDETFDYNRNLFKIRFKLRPVVSDNYVHADLEDQIMSFF